MNKKYVGWYHIPPVWIGKPKLDASDLNYRYTHDFSSNLKLKVSGDGLFLWDLLDWEYINNHPNEKSKNDKTDEERIRQQKIILLFNAYLACLYSGYLLVQHTTIEKMHLTNQDLIVINTFKDNPSQIRVQGHSPISISNLKYLNERMKLYKKDPKFDNTFIIRHTEINKESLIKSTELLKAAIEYEKRDMVEILGLLNKASCLVQSNSDNESLLLSWLVIEAMIERILTDYLEENRIKNINGKEVSFITGDRKKELLNGSNYPVSVKIEILSLVDAIPLDLYKYLTKIRKARNNWIHDLKPVTKSEAMLAISTACSLIRLSTPIDLWLPASSTLTSI